MLARSLRSSRHLGPDLESFIFKVAAIGLRLKAIAVESVVGFKYHAMLNSTGDLGYLVKLPNTCELE